MCIVYVIVCVQEPLRKTDCVSVSVYVNCVQLVCVCMCVLDMNRTVCNELY